MNGKIVRLRGYEKADVDAIMKWINDEEITDLLGGDMLVYPVSSIAEEKFIEASAGPSNTQKNFAIETIAEGKYIGGISFNVIDW
jgi:RimJ/RimL family protein N-acetyltransferase